MGKRIFFFLAIILTLSIVMSLLGIGGYVLPGGGLNYQALMAFGVVA